MQRVCGECRAKSKLACIVQLVSYQLLLLGDNDHLKKHLIRTHCTKANYARDHLDSSDFMVAMRERLRNVHQWLSLFDACALQEYNHTYAIRHAAKQQRQQEVSIHRDRTTR